MKKFYPLVFLFSLPIFISAQQTFQGTYGGTSTDKAVAVSCVSNGYIIAGNTNTTPTNKDVVFFKTDLAGNLAWSKTIGGNADDVAYDMKPTFDGGFIICGETKSFPTSGNDTSNAFLLKLDNSGNILWSHQYGGNGSDAAWSVAQTSDSGFVVTGFTTSFGAGNEDVLAFRTDKNGNQVWKESIGGTGSDFGRAVCTTASGNAFIITGNTNGFSSPGSLVYLLRIAGNGTFQWSKTYDYSVPVSNYQRIGYDVIVNGNNEYLVTGKIGKGSIGDAQAFVMSTDSTGGTINWSYHYFQNSGECSAHSIQHCSGGYIVGGEMGNYYPSMIKIDNVGIRICDKYYSDASFNPKGCGMETTQDANGQFITVGYCSTAPLNDTSIILIKSDSMSVTYCNSHDSFFTGQTADSVTVTTVVSSVVFGGIDNSITFSSTATLLSENSFCNSGIAENNLDEIHFTISPNPFSGEAIFSADKNIHNGTTLRVYDTFGKLVMEKKMETNEMILHAEDFSSGMHYYVVSGKDGNMGRGKFMVE